jgi:hypothetical protein
MVNIANFNINYSKLSPLKSDFPKAFKKSASSNIKISNLALSLCK